MHIWELRLIVASIALLALVVDIGGFLRFAPRIGLPWWAAVTCVIPLKAVEWRFLTVARQLSANDRLGKILSAVLVIVWLAAVGLSAVAAHSTIYSILDSPDLGETRTNLKATLASIDAQLVRLSKPSAPRPVRSVQEALNWVALPPLVRRATDDCRRVEQDDHRKACKEAINLRKELAASRDYEDLQQTAKGLRAQLAALAAGDSMGRSFELMFGGAIKLDGKEGIALTVMLILAVVSALGPFCLDVLISRQGHASASVAARAHSCASATSPSPRQHGRESSDPELADRKSAQGQSPVNPTNSATSMPKSAKPARPIEPISAQKQAEACLPISGTGLPEPRPQLEQAPAHGQADVRPPNVRPPNPGTPEIARQDKPAWPPAVVSAHGQADICPPNLGPPETARHGKSAQPLAGVSGRGQANIWPPTHETKQQAPACACMVKPNSSKRWQGAAAAPAQVQTAIQAFAATLDWGQGMRATGSELWEAYVATRERNGWHDLAANAFGRQIKDAVEARGGWKLKSSSQVYVGVCVPPMLLTKVAAVDTAH